MMLESADGSGWIVCVRQVNMEPNRMLNSKILVAVDGSTASQRSARLAIQLAQLYHDPIDGLYVVDANLLTEFFAGYQAELEEPVKEQTRSELYTRLKEQGERALDEFKRRRFSTRGGSPKGIGIGQRQRCDPGTGAGCCFPVARAARTWACGKPGWAWP